MNETNDSIGYEWQRIEDVPANHSQLASAELKALIGVWQEQRDELTAQDVIKDFNERLLRRWAIETGIIERVYTLDRGITELLIERGLDANLIPHGSTDQDPEYVISVIRDQHKAVEGLFDFVAARRALSTSYIKELHAVLTASQKSTDAIDQFGNRVQVPLRHGDYKLNPNNPRRADGSTHEYCPPEHVAAEMDRMIEMHLQHLELGVCPEVEAAWLHHRFTQVHPFQDGNGRVARALATLIFLKEGWLPLVITDDHRSIYIDALEAGDHGDLEPLVKLFARIEKRSFLEALSVAQEVRQRDRQVHHVIASMRDLYKRRGESLRQEWNRSKSTADELLDEAKQRLGDIVDLLKEQIGPLAAPGQQFQFFVDHSQVGDDRSHWFRFQLIQTARALGYFANFGVYHKWARLVLDTEGRSEILVSLHGIGHDYRGLLVGTACYYRRDVSGDDQLNVSDVVPLCDEPFQVNYKEPVDEARQRFEAWWSPVIVTGLEAVRRTL